MVLVLVLALTGAASARAQEAASAGDNPLAALKADLTRVLADANVPFTDDQDRSITLMMEERLQASESLFGGLMDFRGGPTSGQQAEQLQSAIAWLRNEFLSRVNEYLTEPQLTVWQDYRVTIGPAGGTVTEGRATSPQQTQYVPINNNRFTAEDVQYQGGGGTAISGGSARGDGAATAVARRPRSSTGRRRRVARHDAESVQRRRVEREECVRGQQAGLSGTADQRGHRRSRRSPDG